MKKANTFKEDSNTATQIILSAFKQRARRVWGYRDLKSWTGTKQSYLNTGAQLQRAGFSLQKRNCELCGAFSSLPIRTNVVFSISINLWSAWLSVVLHVDVGDGQPKEVRSGVSPAARATRRGNRRLTRNESRYHSGNVYLLLLYEFSHDVFILLY